MQTQPAAAACSFGAWLAGSRQQRRQFSARRRLNNGLVEPLSLSLSLSLNRACVLRRAVPCRAVHSMDLVVRQLAGGMRKGARASLPALLGSHLAERQSLPALGRRQARAARRD